ncbi:MAG TPA: prolyl oligopeptidase family serine peptidase, partial [Planctomycetaceae bacterium]|nr:prolyl oligopeptidase family serine peptidase [Planctomycetaceae bacterium]
MPYYGERRARGSSRRMISRDPRESVVGMTQGVLDVRRARQWLADRPEVDDERMGVMGISLGGIMAALSGAADPQFRSIAVMIAGGKLARSIWENPIPEAGQFREAWQAAGGTQESFERILDEVDPARYGERLRDRRVLLVAADHDEVFPQASVRALWDSTGRTAKLVWMPEVGHYTCIRFLFREVDRMI